MQQNASTCVRGRGFRPECVQLVTFTHSDMQDQVEATTYQSLSSGQQWPLLLFVALFLGCLFQCRDSKPFRSLSGMCVGGRHSYALVAQDSCYRERVNSSFAHSRRRRVSQIVKREG